MKTMNSRENKHKYIIGIDVWAGTVGGAVAVGVVKLKVKFSSQSQMGAGQRF